MIFFLNDHLFKMVGSKKMKRGSVSHFSFISRESTVTEQLCRN